MTAVSNLTRSSTLWFPDCFSPPLEKWLKSWDWKFSCFLYGSGGWGTQNKGLGWKWSVSEFSFWSFRALTERRYNWTWKLTVPALPLHPGHCFLYMKMDQIGNSMRVSVDREVVGFDIGCQHFTLPQMKINDKMFFHIIQEIILVFKTEFCVYIFFFQCGKIGKVSNTLNKFKNLSTLGPHIQPQTTTHRLEPVKKFFFPFSCNWQSQKSQAGIQDCRLSILIDRNRASPGMRYLLEKDSAEKL